MFGYVNIYKDELKVKDYNTYRSYYCGLCKTLGKEFSPAVRLGLNYDFAFLAIVLSSVTDEKLKIKNERCIAHLINKRPVLKDDIMLSYSAYMSIIVTYFKLKDDVKDDKKLKSLIAMLFYKPHLKKAKKLYPMQYDKVDKLLKLLAGKEKENCGDIDETADCFAKITEELFVPDFIECDEITKKALANFGYNIGRFIYIADAVDDLTKDVKNKNYNPFIVKYGYNGEEPSEFKKMVAEKQDFTLMLTLESVASAFELIEFKKNREIIENIVYLGLRGSKDRALKGE